MSLYRTWRPRTFADLVGQDAVVKTLTTALETGRLAHAYLFSGPRGSGKTSAAKILARCIECVNGPTATPDNTCENCTAIIEGTALDVLEIDAASNRGIDEIRALRDAVKYPPATMRSKVYIIDEAHMLTKEGANAFLKTLEEPPEWAVFVLATTAPESLPPTILSRCQRYAFRRIAIPTMIARMRAIADAEGIAIDDAALGAIAYRADGGLRDALTMLEQVAAFANGPVDAAVVEAAFGQTGRAFARALRDEALDGEAAAALRTIDEASDAGTDMTGLIRSTIAEFRHLLVARVNPELLSRDLAEDDAQAARERAAQTPQPRLVRALRLLADALAAARGSGNARLELESALLRFVLQGEDPSLDALAARVAALETGAPTLRQAQGDIVAAPARARTAEATTTPTATATTTPTAAAATTPTATAATTPTAKVATPTPTVATPSTATARTPATTVPASDDVRETSASSSDVTLSSSKGERPDAPSKAAPQPVAAQPASPPIELSLQKLRTRWSAIRQRAEEVKPSLNAPLSRATVEALDGETVVLRIPIPPMADIVKRDLATLKKAIADATGHALEIRVVSGAAGPPPGGGSPNGGGEPPDDDEGGLLDYALKTLPAR
ncbi:MAG TPA: DNA polymerase III subunit gamma/tau [Candidatus Elarobacter sp.]|nr:DNA polymerase III subunit gamma/tau [Candidatus Elarobacter sp.]